MEERRGGCPLERLENFSEKLCLPLSSEEIRWALNKVKKDATPGQDGIGVRGDDVG